MTKTKSKTPASRQPAAASRCQHVDCTDCMHATLIQYDDDPLLAECRQKPQPYSARFPYAVEVARAKRQCPMHQHADTQKWIQHRLKVRRVARACFVRSQQQEEA